jgi:uncharacterized protein (DUF305 family)
VNGRSLRLRQSLGANTSNARIAVQMKPYFAGLLVSLCVPLVVSACSSSRESPPPAPSSSAEQPAITGQPAGFNADDVAFVTDMITSYRQTTALTKLVPAHSTDPDLIALASDIDAAQGPDLEMVKVFSVQWNSNTDSGTDADHGGSAKPVVGMVDDATMATLGSLSGAEFDTTWLQSMIGHQQGAIAMAEAEVARGTNVDAVATAKRLVGTYQAQIARMQQILAAG